MDDRVKVIVNTSKSYYRPGDPIEATLRVITNEDDLQIAQALVEWQTVTTFVAYPDLNKVLWRQPQDITQEVIDSLGAGKKEVPLRALLPTTAPTSLDHHKEVEVTTQLVLDLTMAGIKIHHEYPIKVVRPLADESKSVKGILQTIEFPINGWCCSKNGLAEACIELRKQV